MINYALLSVRNHPLLEYFLNELKSRNSLPKAIIFDKKNLSEEEIERYCDRTGQRLDKLNFFLYIYYHLKIFDVESHNNNETLNILRNFDIDFLVNGGTTRILKQEIIDETNFGILNCHPGILPFFKGCSCVEWSIIQDEPVGNSIHWMNKEIDSGPIVKHKITECYKSDNYQDIRKRVYQDGVKLLAELIEQIAKSPANLLKNSHKGEIISGGIYYKPMDEESLDIVKNKVNNKQYKFQN